MALKLTNQTAYSTQEVLNASFWRNIQNADFDINSDAQNVITLPKGTRYVEITSPVAFVWSFDAGRVQPATRHASLHTGNADEAVPIGPMAEPFETLYFRNKVDGEGSGQAVIVQAYIS